MPQLLQVRQQYLDKCYNTLTYGLIGEGSCQCQVHKLKPTYLSGRLKAFV